MAGSSHGGVPLSAGRLRMGRGSGAEGLGMARVDSLMQVVRHDGTMLAGRPWSEWVERYGRSYTHPLNRALHLVGIPLILLALPLACGAVLQPRLAGVALLLFLVGWALQFAGHAVEGKPPEFLQDPRFLLVGLRWWWLKWQPGNDPQRPHP